MPIGLTDYVKPKNDAFTGIVQASQVLGGGGHGTFPDATVALSNLTQHDVLIAAAVLVDHAIVRGAGGGRGVQDSSVIIADNGVVSVPAIGSGDVTDYDFNVGDTTTPDYGIIRIGNSIIGRTSYNVANIHLDGAFIIRNVGGPVTGDVEFIVTESTGNTCRFALPKSGVGLATYNPRSMLIAGPAPADTDFVKVSYWQTQGIFHNLVCDTSGVGADLGVQNDLEVEGDIFVDSIKESTTAAGITLTGMLILVDSASVPPLNVTERSAEPSAPSAHDIYLDDGTNTASGNPGWRRYTGAAWEDVSAGAGGSGDTHPMVDTTELVKGSVDATKIAKIECDTNIPTATTVVVTWPSAALDLETVKDHLADTSDPHGATMSASTKVQTPEIENSGNITIDANNGAPTTVTILNSNLFNTEASLDIPEGDITLSGTVDGRAVAADGTKLDGIEAAADVTDATNVDAAGAVMEVDFNANTILAATADDTPAAVTVAEQTLVGRITAGNITALTTAQVKTLLAYLQNLVEDTTPQLGGELDCQARSVGFTVHTYTGVVGTTDIDWRTGNKAKFTFGAGNETITFTAPSKPGSFICEIIQDGTGSRLVVAWPTIKWIGQTLPVLTTGAGAIDVVALYYNGSYWIGQFAADAGTP